MKIIALADTHIERAGQVQKLPAELVQLLMGADIVIHAGDFVTKAAYEEFSGICKLEAVHGNMDDLSLKELLPARRVIEVEGKKIGIIHEAALSIQDMTGARYMAKEMGVDVLIFGHLHRPVIERSDVLIACPGSPTLPRLSDPCVIEMILENEKISLRIIKFEGTKCGALESARDFDKLP